MAIGLVMYGVTDASQIADRLKVYEKVRYNQASFIQVMSNVGFDETPPPELVNYLEGRPVPSKWPPRPAPRRRVDHSPDGLCAFRICQ